MEPNHLPPECLPRRSPEGWLEPITIHVRVTSDRKYLPRLLPVIGGPFRDIDELEGAARAFYSAIYLSWHRRTKPHDPPPPSPDRLFQFEFLVDRVDGDPSPPPAQMPQESAHVSSLKESLSAATLEEKPSAVSSSSCSRQPHQDTAMDMDSPPSGRIWERLRRDWGFVFCIRVDLGGSFHTYPYAGGPFQSLEEVDKAMDRYFHEHRDPKLLMHQGGPSSLEMAIEKTLYWPDGKRKRSKSDHIERGRYQRRQLVQALVDKHNEDHNLLGEFAYELKDVVHFREFCEKRTWYYHLNFTMTKGAGDFNRGIKDLFFAEVKCVRPGTQEMSVSCFCMVKPTDNGHCYGCTKNGNFDMKHPNRADEYIGGHLDVGLPLGCPPGWSYWDDDDVEAKKKKLRVSFKGADDPEVKELLTVPPTFWRVHLSALSDPSLCISEESLTQPKNLETHCYTSKEK